MTNKMFKCELTQMSSKEVAQKRKQFVRISKMVGLKHLRTKIKLEGLDFEEAKAQLGHNKGT